MTCVDIGAGFNIDFVDELYCVRVKLEIDEMQMLEWQLEYVVGGIPFLTAKDVPGMLKLCEMVYSACAMSRMLDGSELWPVWR